MDIDSTYRDAYNFCIGLLSRREHSCTELTTKLTSKGYSDEIIDNVLTNLQKENYQCDQRFTEVFCRSKISAKYGPRKISHSLKKHGISESAIRCALDEYSQQIIDNAVALVERKLPRSDIAQGLRDLPLKSKITRALANKGYNFETISLAFEILTEEYDD